MTLARIRSTSDSKIAAGLRLALAVLFLMTGAMKLLVPMLADAWSGQLVAAGIPLYTISRWSVPFLEIAVGLALGVGFVVRLAGLVVIGIMIVATYVHIVVDDPSLELDLGPIRERPQPSSSPNLFGQISFSSTNGQDGRWHSSRSHRAGYTRCARPGAPIGSATCAQACA